jgi:hypothetical protein
MTLTRMAVLLSGALLVMLAVIILRAESARIHFRVSQLDAQADGFRQQLREQELELQRLRNPALIRARAGELKLPASAPAPAPRPAISPIRKKSPR